MKQIQFKWFYWLHLLIAAILGVSILIGSTYVITLIDEGPFFLKLLPLPFFMSGLFLLYFCLAICLNYTTVSIEGKHIIVSTKPIYWHKSISLPISEIQRLKTIGVRRQGENERLYSYKINAAMTDGSEKVLVPSSIPIEHNNGLKLKESIEMMLLEA